MREVGVEELFAAVDDPFVRHHLDPATTRRAWVRGAAVVVDGEGRRGTPVGGRMFVCLGPADSLDPLMAAVAGSAPPPARISVEAASYDALPPAWRFPALHTATGHWHWMLTRSYAEPRPVVEPAVEPVVVEDVLDAAEVDEVLDIANPGSFARPGTPGVECWLGIRAGGALVAVGALVRQPDGSGHLRGVTVLPTHTGAGLGRALSAALTRRGLASGPGVVTLGVYVDNAPAVAVYRRLGYAVEHTFRSGAVGAAPLGG